MHDELANRRLNDCLVKGWTPTLHNWFAARVDSPLFEELQEESDQKLQRQPTLSTRWASRVSRLPGPVQQRRRGSLINYKGGSGRIS